MRSEKHGPGAFGSRSTHFQTAAALCLLLSLFAWMLPKPALGAGSVTAEGTFPHPTGYSSISASGNIILNSVLDRGYQISRPEAATTLTEFDLRSLATLRTLEVPPITEGLAQQTTEWLWAMDESRHRLFFLIDDVEAGFDNKKLVAVDLNTLTTSAPVTMWSQPGNKPMSLSYDPVSDRLYIMVNNAADLGGAALRVEERSPDGTLTGQHRLSSCFGALDFHYPPTTVRSRIERSLVYLNCYSSNGVQSQVVKIDIGQDGTLDDADREIVFPAVPGPLSTMFDPGSDRMFFLTANKGAGRGAWVFDGLNDSFLGVIATGDTQGTQEYALGIDALTGRLYMQSPAGLVIADARRTPLPSGLLFKEFAANGYGQIVADTKNNRVFIQDADSKNPEGLPQSYRVLRDTTPISFDPKPGDPDALTTDVDEKEGLTGANLAGSGRAFAIRSLTTGGVQRAAWNVTLPNIAPDDLSIADGALYSVPLDPGNRDLYIGRVHKVATSDGEFEASSIFSEADDATDADLDANDLEWPFDPTSCRNSDGATRADDPNGLSAVSCNAGASSAWAAAGSGAATNEGTQIRSSAAFTAIWRDQRGLVVHSEAVARGIGIGPSVHIGEVRTVAETYAKGRKGSARGSFDRYISDVAIDTDGNGTADFKCDQCDSKPVQAAVRQALGGKVTVLFPEPDPVYHRGTPGGFQAIIEKDRFLSYSERSLNDDDSPEVVGMEIIYYADAKAGRSRQVVQLAGVQAESHYGIFLIPSTQSGSDLGRFVEDARSLGSDALGTLQVLPTVNLDEIGGPTTVFERVVKTISKGWRMFRSQPGEAALLMALWSFFVMPIYMIQRRRLLALR